MSKAKHVMELTSRKGDPAQRRPASIATYITTRNKHCHADCTHAKRPAHVRQSSHDNACLHLFSLFSFEQHNARTLSTSDEPQSSSNQRTVKQNRSTLTSFVLTSQEHRAALNSGQTEGRRNKHTQITTIKADTEQGHGPVPAQSCGSNLDAQR